MVTNYIKKSIEDASGFENQCWFFGTSNIEFIANNRDNPGETKNFLRGYKSTEAFTSELKSSDAKDYIINIKELPSWYLIEQELAEKLVTDPNSPFFGGEIKQLEIEH